MAYRILAYTFDDRVNTADGRPPFYNESEISFADASETEIYLDADGNRFKQVIKSHPLGQRLLVDATIGETDLPEGTVLSFKMPNGSKIKDPTTQKSYVVLIAGTATTNKQGPDILNDYRTVFVFPSDPDDTQPFDPTKSYKQVGIATSSSYYLPATEIPTSYLKTPCFVAGTLIDTARGPRPVETLRAGDLVVTRDRGVRPLCWAGRRMLSAQHLRLAPHLRPVRIRAGALGPGLPARDLFVSPQHRVLLRSALAARHCGAAEVLVAALHLCSLRGVRQHDPPDGVAYHHLLFDRHEIVRSNGCWSESLYTGPQAMLSLSPQARQEIAALYPHLIAPGAEIRPGARPFLAGRQGRDIAQAHRRTGAPLFSAAETKDPRIPA